MKVCVVGTGYVGLVTGAGLAEMGNEVTCVDVSEKRVTDLNNLVMPFHEPGLEDVVRANKIEGRLTFTTELAQGLKDARICFVAVGTPPNEDGSSNLSAVFKVAKDVSELAQRDLVFAVKSTVPIGTAKKIKEIVADSSVNISVASNPEFLAQGAAVNNFFNPDRIVIGSDDPKVFDTVQELYAPFLRSGNPVITMDITLSLIHI